MKIYILKHDIPCCRKASYTTEDLTSKTININTIS